MKRASEREAHRELIVLAVVTAILAIAGFFVSPLLSLGILVGGGITFALHLIQIKKRRSRIRQLSDELSRILQGQNDLNLSAYQEGELAVLQCELQKLLTHLAHAGETVAEEKRLLADSLADISHQLRTPLTSMELIMARLQTPELSESERRRLLRELQTMLTRTEWLIDALLKLSRLDAGTVKLHREPVSLQKLLDLSVQPLQIAFELRELTLIIPSLDATILCDLNWTAEALGNLLKNAMEHTPPGGTVTIAAEKTALYVQLQILDTGPGFSQEDLPHLFDRFYRGKTAAPGSFGIGLSLARRILAEQDCTIKAANRLSGGAEFTIRFYESTV